jgi:DNA polymerase I-like protein with 3'-5' exonuclease and polymerase domains
MKTRQLTWKDLLLVDVPLESNVIVEGEVSEEEWDKYLDLFDQAKIIGLDLETHGDEEYSALYFRFGLIRLISVSFQVGDNYFALIYDLGGNLDDLREKKQLFISSRFFQILKSKCEDLDVPVVGQNLKFDGNFLLYHFSIQLLNCRDLMLCSQVIWAGIEVVQGSQNKGKGTEDRCLLPHSLKAVTERISILYNTEFLVDKTEQKEDWGWNISNAKYNYSGNDSILPIRLYPYIQDVIVKENLYYSVMAECLALSSFIQMEVYGYPIDMELLDINLEIYTNKVNEYYETIKSTFPDINPTQNQLLQQAFNDKWPELELESLDAEALSQLEHPEAKALLRMRTLNVLIAYMKKVKDTAWKNKGDDFYSVRTNYYQIAPAGSGRSRCEGQYRYTQKNSNGTTSSKKIIIGCQLQNPSKTPDWFKAEGLPGFRTFFKVTDEYFLGIVDLSASHYRICTELTKDPVLLEIYANGKDAHLIMGYTISQLDKTPYKGTFEEFCKEYKDGSVLVKKYRSWGKTANYSGLNQAGKFRIQQSFKKNGVIISLEDAELIQKAYRSTYKVLYQFIQDYVKATNTYNIQFPFFNKNGKPTEGRYGKCKTFTNRTVHLKKLEKPAKGNWPARWEVPYTDSIALIWLCGEADILKFAQGRIQIEFFKNPHWKARFCNNCHDELNWMGLREYAYEVNNCVMSILHQELRYWIKSIPVDVDFDPNNLTHTSWNDK